MPHDSKKRENGNRGGSSSDGSSSGGPLARSALRRGGRDLTSGPVGHQMIRLAGPMAVGMLAMMTFNLVDTWFVSRLGTAPLAAISLTFPVIMVVGSLALGVGVGATSLISRAVGAGRQQDVRRLTTDALLLGLMLVILVSAVGLATIDPLFRAMGADDVTLPLVRQYMSIWYFGAAFVVIPMIGNSAIRATGDTKTPALIMIFASLVNVGVDPVLIFGLGPIPALGMRGAAIATVIGRASTMVASLWVLGPGRGMIERRFHGLRSTAQAWGRILLIGLPAALGYLAQPLTVGLLTAMVAVHGRAAVAAFGAGGRVEMMALIPFRALGSGLMPFMGQNWGAIRTERIRGALRRGFLAVLVLGMLDYGILFVLARPIASLFSSDPAVLSTMVLYLWIMPAAHWALGLAAITNSTFNAVGRPFAAASVILLRAPVLTWPFALVGGYFFGVTGIFLGSVAASVTMAAFAWWWLASLRTTTQG